eukprot:TRINITY_DN29841_c0_g1_i1.p1 TRINITY_DN29841_c0_g1~~TRINITY_DN29841_c0_g1_i1.p1  ORF type:complete len:583 (-),score=42.93 TRINITY_DN29841_c0_g1_i1:229-1737(-)
MLKLVGNKSDPYVRLSVGAEMYTTEVVYECLNPRWTAQHFTFPIFHGSHEDLVLQVWDSNGRTLSDDVEIGSASVDFRSLTTGIWHPLRLSLTPPGRSAGTCNFHVGELEVEVFYLAENMQNLWGKCRYLRFFPIFGDDWVQLVHYISLICVSVWFTYRALCARSVGSATSEVLDSLGLSHNFVWMRLALPLWCGLSALSMYYARRALRSDVMRKVASATLCDVSASSEEAMTTAREKHARGMRWRLRLTIFFPIINGLLFALVTCESSLKLSHMLWFYLLPFTFATWHVCCIYGVVYIATIISKQDIRALGRRLEKDRRHPLGFWSDVHTSYIHLDERLHELWAMVYPALMCLAVLVITGMFVCLVLAITTKFADVWITLAAFAEMLLLSAFSLSIASPLASVTSLASSKNPRGHSLRTLAARHGPRAMCHEVRLEYLTFMEHISNHSDMGVRFPITGVVRSRTLYYMLRYLVTMISISVTYTLVFFQRGDGNDVDHRGNF